MHSAGETNMAGRQTNAGPWLIKAPGVLAALTATLLLGACAQTAEAPLHTLSQAGDQKNEAETPGRAKTELEKATEYWGRQYAQNPRDRKAAISYARNLKAGGQKEQALAVLQHASIYNGENRELASEYGRLALEVDQVSLAEKLLTAADDPSNPDWRVVSARGTVLAKQGNYKDAIPLFERALALAPEHPSLLNNLALAQAASGQADAAEALLRRAAKAADGDARIRQNLALVLGLQGKFDEAKQVAAQDLPSDAAPANVNSLRKTVRLAPQQSVAPVTQDKAAGAAPALRGGANETAAASGADPWVTQVAQSPVPRR
jgi:Flp pilus assembly protein TadD